MTPRHHAKARQANSYALGWPAAKADPDSELFVGQRALEHQSAWLDHIGRYHHYRCALARQSWAADGVFPSKDQPTSLREFKRTFAQVQAYISERDIGDEERLRRHELPLKDEELPLAGASQESINFIRDKILGLPVDEPPETMD